jgi:hypothetical protein
MAFDDLPTRRPGDKPIPGPHVIVHDDGTRQMVFAGPNTMRRPSPWRRELGDLVWGFASAFAGLAGITAAILLALEYPQLTVSSRLACGTITVLVCAGFTVRFARRWRARH